MSKIKKILKNGVFLVISLFSRLIVKHDKRWVFGAWFGTKFADNSKWLYLKVIKDYKQIEAVWITKDKAEINYINSIGGKALLYNSLQANYYVATADVVFMTHDYIDVSPIYLINNAYKVQLWHGVALKKIGFDVGPDNNRNIAKKLKCKIIDVWKICDLYIAPSEEYASKVKSAFNTTDDKVLRVGQPRSDLFFYENDRCSKFSNKKVITYMPTFRDNQSVFDFNNIKAFEAKALNILLNKYNAVIVQKKHFVDSINNKVNKNTMENVINIDNMDTQELLFSTDILITDYSSCYFDFLLLNRPIIHYVYDHKYYNKEDRGLYYKLKDACGGKISYEFSNLLKCIEEYLIDPNLDSIQRANVKNRFVTFEDGKSSEKMIKFIMKKKYEKQYVDNNYQMKAHYVKQNV